MIRINHFLKNHKLTFKNPTRGSFIKEFDINLKSYQFAHIYVMCKPSIFSYQFLYKFMCIVWFYRKIHSQIIGLKLKQIVSPKSSIEENTSNHKIIITKFLLTLLHFQYYKLCCISYFCLLVRAGKDVLQNFKKVREPMYVPSINVHFIKILMCHYFKPKHRWKKKKCWSRYSWCFLNSTCFIKQTWQKWVTTELCSFKYK